MTLASWATFAFSASKETPPVSQAVEPALDPGRGELAPAVIGDRSVIGDLGGRQEILIDRQKIGTPKIRAEHVELLADLGGKPQIFGIAEQVAVFPKSAGAEALAGVVGKPGADRAMHSLGRIDRHPHLSGMLRIGGGCDLDGAEQPGFDQRPARLFDLARVVDLAALPANTPLDIGGIEPLEPVDRDRAEAHDRPRVERVGHVHRLRVAVDLDPAVLYLGKRMAAIAKRRQPVPSRSRQPGRCAPGRRV